MFRSFGVMPSAIDEQDADDLVGVFIRSVKDADKDAKKKQSRGKSRYNDDAPSEATLENVPPHLWAYYGLR